MSSYILKITGKRPQIFIDMLIRLHINFALVEQTYQFVVIEVLEEDYEKIQKLKTSYEITIIKRKGFAYLLYILHTKKIFLGAIFIGFLLLTLLSNMTFSIQIIETDQEIKDIIMADLKEFGIEKYRFKVSYDQKEAIRTKILEKEKEILEWLEIEEKGTSYQVKLIKRVQQEPIETAQPRHLVAKKSGMIVEIQADHGEILVQKNQYVEAGDILVSGIIKNKEEIVSQVAAEGKVYAEVWYTVNMQLPFVYEEEQPTGRSKQVLEFNFLHHTIALNDFFPYQHANNQESVLWKHSLLPFYISFTNKKEVTIQRMNYSEDQAHEAIVDLATEKLRTKLGDDIEIISEKVLKKETTTDRINIELFFKVKEDITSYRSISEEELLPQEETNE